MNTLLLIGGIGMQEILVIALIVLLLFGGKKIPELMKGIGKGVLVNVQSVDPAWIHVH